MAKKSRAKLYESCKVALQKKLEEVEEALKVNRSSLNPTIAGDPGDMSQAIEERHTASVRRDKYELLLRDVRQALSRLEDGSYGVCEETGEDIEERRLEAIPWTRFSIEGAEIRERSNRRYAESHEDAVFDEMGGSSSSDEDR